MNNKLALFLIVKLFLSFQVLGQNIQVNPSLLTGFQYNSGSGPSSEQSFEIWGSSLTDDISIVPPTNYEISLGTGGTFVATNPLTLPEVGGGVGTTTIYVRLKAGLDGVSYNNEDITASTPGASNKTVTCSGKVFPDLVINEVLADPAGDSSDDLEGDANGDGTRHALDDEFVEIINNETVTINFGGYTLSDYVGVRHTFPNPTNISAGQSIVVFGGGTPTDIPGTSQVASTGSLELTNGGDEITVKMDQLLL